jgi:lysophospholipase L1-like esterase
MKRLITFGDSWTAGHGVEDNIEYKEDGNPLIGKGFFINLRRFNSWPRYLSDKLDCPFVNNGYSGSGNDNIKEEIKVLIDNNLLNHEDVIVIMFSYPHRNRDGSNANDPVSVFNEIDQLLDGYKRFYFNSFYPTFKDEVNFDVSTLPHYFINPRGTVSDYLRDYEIKHDISVWEYGSRSVWNDEKNFYEGDYHPNLLGYKLIGEHIYEEIKKYL